MELFNTPISSGVLVALTVVYAVCAAITTFDIRIIQAKKAGFLRPNHPVIPNWTGVFGWLLWGTWIAIFLLNWKYALALFVIKFILKVVPVLENLGAVLLMPIIGKEAAASVNVMVREQKKASQSLKSLSKAKSPEEAKEVLRKFSE